MFWHDLSVFVLNLFLNSKTVYVINQKQKSQAKHATSRKDPGNWIQQNAFNGETGLPFPDNNQTLDSETNKNPEPTLTEITETIPLLYYSGSDDDDDDDDDFHYYC